MIKESKSKLIKVFLDLAVSDRNSHVGSGFGGNVFELLVLMSMSHLMNLNEQCIMRYDSVIKTMSWGTKWLEESSLQVIRLKITEVVNAIPESEKLLPALLLRQNFSSFKEIILENKNYFPHAIAFINGGELCEETSNIEKFILANILCQDLADELDNNIINNIDNYALKLKKFPPEIILFSIRSNINICRIIKHNLDENKYFSKILNNINSLLV